MTKLGSVKNVRIRSLTIAGVIIKNSKIIIEVGSNNCRE